MRRGLDGSWEAHQKLPPDAAGYFGTAVSLAGDVLDAAGWSDAVP